MVEVEVADRDRVELGPGLALAQLREHARPAVEQQAPGALDQVSRLGPARVGPGRRAADDGQAHARQTRGEPRLTTPFAYPPVTADSQTDPSRSGGAAANLVLSKRTEEER